mgnify:CR=1 FL=1
MIKTKKKIIYLGVFLVLGLFLISACSQTKGARILQNSVDSVPLKNTISFVSFDYQKTFEASVYSPYLPMKCGESSSYGGNLNNAQIVGIFCHGSPYSGGDNINIGSRWVSKSSDGKIVEAACEGAVYGITDKYDVKGTIVCAYTK